MKIAVASSDGVAVSGHFGRSACFIVYEIQDNKVINREIRQNGKTAFAQGQCHGDGHGHEHAHHGHGDVIEALKDCQTILCQGMGWRAAEELTANGIQPLIFEDAPNCDDAVASYLRGEVKMSGSFCSCHE